MNGSRKFKVQKPEIRNPKSEIRNCFQRGWLWLFVGLLCLLGLLTPVQAIPVFARTYGVSCDACHSGFPRLNPRGLAFKANNFRMPTIVLAWEKTLPLAVQIKPTEQRFEPSGTTVKFTDSQLLGGGLLTPRTAFFLHHSYYVFLNNRFADTRPQEFPTYELWVQQVLDERSQLMLKVGQFEFPYAYSPEINRTTVFSPLLFGAGTHNNDVRLGSAMRGIQLSGVVSNRVRWAIASGAPAKLAPGNVIGQRAFLGGPLRDLFIRVSNNNFSNTIAFVAYFTHPPRNPTDSDTKEHGERYGLEWARLWENTQLHAMVVYGENSDPRGLGRRGFVRSGFIEIDHMLLPWLGLTGRWEAQTLDNSFRQTYSDAKTISLRIYPIQNFQNLKLVAEYQQQDHARHRTALLASLAF